MRRGPFRFILSAVMKTVIRAVAVCWAAVMICGCASRRSEPLYHAGDETAPEFLTGPAAIVLTNTGGYSAHLTGTMLGSGGQAHTVAGEILARDGRLIFQPAFHGKNKRQRKTGGLFFIWDAGKQAGYVLSDALQGYAPIKSDLMVTNESNLGKDGIEEEVDGHPCHRSEIVVSLNDGTTGRLVLWRADDLKHFPVRIEVVNGPKQTTLNLSEVRLEFPGQELFSPPDGFTPYASSVTLMNELLVRESTMAKQYQNGEFDDSTPVSSGLDWHQSPTVR